MSRPPYSFNINTSLDEKKMQGTVIICSGVSFPGARNAGDLFLFLVFGFFKQQTKAFGQNESSGLNKGYPPEGNTWKV